MFIIFFVHNYIVFQYIFYCLNNKDNQYQKLMSAYSEEGCRVPSYGSYSSCSNCGVSGARSSWNTLDPCTSASSSCQTSPPYGNYTPDNRCDFQEKMSRNIFDWKEAFDYGTTKTHFGPGLDYGKNGSGCIYMGSMTPEDASFPWGYELAGVYKDASYAGYVGDLNKSRINPYRMSDGNSCGYDIDLRRPRDICDRGRNGPLEKASQLGFLPMPFVNYEQL